MLSRVPVSALLRLRWAALDLRAGSLSWTSSSGSEVLSPLDPLVALLLCEVGPAPGPDSLVFGDSRGRSISVRRLRLEVSSLFARRGEHDHGGLRQLRRLGRQPSTLLNTRALACAWSTLAARATDAFAKLDDGELSAHAYAFASEAVALEKGWDDPRVDEWLRAALAQQNPDGGFGLGRSYDPFGYGDPNPPETSYVVSVTGHVGRVLLAAHRAGKVSDETIRSLVELVLQAPRQGGGVGTCLGYSMRRKDARECVNNVNQAAGWFLAGAIDRGLGDDRARRLLSEITQRQAANYRPALGGWRYIEERDEPNDFNHEAGSIEGALRLSPPIGADAGSRYMTRRDYRRWLDPLGQVRLLPYFPAHAASQLDAFEYMLDHEGQSASLLAQFAAYASRTACHLREQGGH